MAIATDNFNRADGAIGANYTALASFNKNFNIVSNQLSYNDVNGAAYYNVTPFAVPMYAQIDEVAGTINNTIGVLLMDVSGNYYSAQRGASNGTLTFTRNGIAIGSGYTPGSFIAGTLRIENNLGGVISVKLNGSQIDTYTDGSPFASIAIGICCATGSGNVRADNFEGGDLVTTALLDEDGEWPMTVRTW